MIVSGSDIALLFSSTLTYAAPLIIASLGSLMSETSGIVNIGIEGKMTIGAFVCAAVTTVTGNPWFGLLCAAVTGCLFGLLHSLACITLKADQTISGIAINLLAPGLAIFFCKVFFHGSTQTLPIDLDNKLPRIFTGIFPSIPEISMALGNYLSVYLCILLALVIWFLLL